MASKTKSKIHITNIEVYFKDRGIEKETIIDEIFYIPIPKSLINKLGWTEDTDLLILTDGDKMILNKQVKSEVKKS